MSNVKVIAYAIGEDEIIRDASVEHINLVLNKYTARHVWLRGIEVNDYLQFEGGGYLDDDEVEVDFIRHEDTGVYTVVFKNNENKEKLIEMEVGITELEDLLSQAA